VWYTTQLLAGMFGVVMYFFTQNIVFYALAMFHAAMILVFMPRRDNIAVLLQLTREEAQQLLGKKN
jgi:hypothetical protein